MYVEPALTASTCPIRSQLLGLHTSNAELFSPSASLPLAAWLRSIGVDTQTTGFDVLKNGVRPAPTARMIGDIGHATFPRNEQSVLNIEAGGPVEVTVLPPSSMDDVGISVEEYAAHRLTMEERSTLLDHGYLALGAEGGLRTDDVSELRSSLERAGGGREHHLLPIFSQANPALQETTLAQNMLTCPRVLPKVCDAIGWNIHMSTAFAAYPSGASTVTWGRLDGQLCAEVATAGVDLPCLGLVAVFSLQSPSHDKGNSTEPAAITVLPYSHRMLNLSVFFVAGCTGASSIPFGCSKSNWMMPQAYQSEKKRVQLLQRKLVMLFALKFQLVELCELCVLTATALRSRTRVVAYFATDTTVFVQVARP